MNTKQIADYFKILSDETRIKIVFMLKNGTMCACNILENLHITQPTLSYHMKMLTDNNIVTSEKRGVWVHYSINPAKLEELTAFLTIDNCDCSQNNCSCKGKN